MATEPDTLIAFERASVVVPVRRPVRKNVVPKLFGAGTGEIWIEAIVGSTTLALTGATLPSSIHATMTIVCTVKTIAEGEQKSGPGVGTAIDMPPPAFGDANIVGDAGGVGDIPPRDEAVGVGLADGGIAGTSVTWPLAQPLSATKTRSGVAHCVRRHHRLVNPKASDLAF